MTLWTYGLRNTDGVSFLSIHETWARAGDKIGSREDKETNLQHWSDQAYIFLNCPYLILFLSIIFYEFSYRPKDKRPGKLDIPVWGWFLLLRTFASIHSPLVTSGCTRPFMLSTLHLTNDGIIGICYHNSANSGIFTVKCLLDESLSVNHPMAVWLVWPPHLTVSAGGIRTL